MSQEEYRNSPRRSQYRGGEHLAPSSRTLDTPWGPIRVNCADGWGASHRKPEYDDVARLAREHGVPFQQVQTDAVRNLPAEGEETR